MGLLQKQHPTGSRTEPALLFRNRYRQTNRSAGTAQEQGERSAETGVHTE